MKIGDEVYVHGYVDEIRKDCIIIRNEGGYFGTVSNEMFYYEEDGNGYGTMNTADTPQTDLLVKTLHKSRESHEKNCETCRDKDAYDEWEGNCDECENGSMYTPQTDCEACELDGKADVCKVCRVSYYKPQPKYPWK